MSKQVSRFWLAHVEAIHGFPWHLNQSTVANTQPEVTSHDRDGQIMAMSSMGVFHMQQDT